MICNENDCGTTARRSGYCDRHYRQRRRKGLIGWDGTVCRSDGCERPAVSLGLCHNCYARHRLAAAPECAVDGCSGPVVAREWCRKHYARFIRHGEPLAYKKVRARCSVEGCGKSAVGQQLCDLHYRRMRRYGTVELPTKPPVVDPQPFTCRYCATPLPKLSRSRLFYCSSECKNTAMFLSTKAKARATHLMQKYGLTVEQYETLLANQAGACAICKVGQPGSKGWHVDHDHATGAVRGILCQSCNQGIGQLRDDPDILATAIEYLRGASRQYKVTYGEAKIGEKVRAAREILALYEAESAAHPEVFG